MEIVRRIKKLNSISRARLNFLRRPILCTTLYRNPMQASNFSGTFDQLFLWIYLCNFHRGLPLYFFYTMVQKSQKWPKTQIKGGPSLNNDPARTWKHQVVSLMRAWHSSLFRLVSTQIALAALRWWNTFFCCSLYMCYREQWSNSGLCHCQKKKLLDIRTLLYKCTVPVNQHKEVGKRFGDHRVP